MVRRAVRPETERGRDGGRATIHAADPRDPATEVDPGAEPPGGGPTLGGRPGDRLRRRATGPRRRARLASGRGAQRRGVGGPALRAADAAHAASARPRLRDPACRAPQPPPHPPTPPPPLP